MPGRQLRIVHLILWNTCCWFKFSTAKQPHRCVCVSYNSPPSVGVPGERAMCWTHSYASCKPEWPCRHFEVASETERGCRSRGNLKISKYASCVLKLCYMHDNFTRLAFFLNVRENVKLLLLLWLCTQIRFLLTVL